MIDKFVALADLPISVVAQLDDVFVFQTKAITSGAIGSNFDNNEFSDTYYKHDNHDSPYNKDVAHAAQRLKLQPASYGEFNLGLHVDDDSRQVLINRMRLLAAINRYLHEQQRSAIQALYWVNQVHGKQIHEIDKVAGGTRFNMCPLDADAMISQQLKVGLAIMTADCVPIVLYQPTSGQVAAIHAGWQGLACGVIKASAERFDSSAPIMAWIGACISQANYEVDKPVLDKLRRGCLTHHLLDSAELDNFESLFSTPAISSADSDVAFDVNLTANTTNDKLLNSTDLQKNLDKLSDYATLSTDKIPSDKVKLNLPKLAAAQLKKLAIRVANEGDIDCSYRNTSYYSYRRQTHLHQSATGRMALVIVRSCKA